MVGSYPYGLDVDFENAHDFFLFVESFNNKELFSEFVLCHHAIEGVVRFSTVLVKSDTYAL